jgi:hypothetical protein
MMKARLAILVVLLGSGAALAVKPEKPGCSDHALLQAENSVRAADRPRSHPFPPRTYGRPRLTQTPPTTSRGSAVL